MSGALHPSEQKLALLWSTWHAIGTNKHAQHYSVRLAITWFWRKMEGEAWNQIKEKNSTNQNTCIKKIPLDYKHHKANSCSPVFETIPSVALGLHLLWDYWTWILFFFALESRGRSLGLKVLKNQVLGKIWGSAFLSSQPYQNTAPNQSWAFQHMKMKKA